MTGRRIIIGRGAQPPRKQIPGIAHLGPFTTEQSEMIRKGRITAWPISGNLRPPRIDALQPLRKITRVLDGDSQDTGQTMITTMQAPITIRSATALIDLTLNQDNHRLALQDVHAILCGYQNADELRQAWFAQHPRTLIIRLVTFAYQDVRDPDYFLDTVNGYTTSPVRSIDPDAAAIPAHAQAWITHDAHIAAQQRTARQRQDQQARSLAIRMKDAGKRRDPAEIRAIADQALQLADELEQAA